MVDRFDSTRRFSNRVANYVRARPRYPRAALDLLVRQIGLAPEWVIADVGSGTGFSAELFVNNGNLVYGVEPNREMRQAAEVHLGGFANFRSVDGTAEATGLDEGSVDCVVAGQAFHWFDAAKARAEFFVQRHKGGAPFPQGAEAAVGDDAEEPGAKGGFRSERLNTAKGLDKALLGQVFGVLGIAGQVPAQAVDPVLVAFKDLTESHWIALLAGGDQSQVKLLLHARSSVFGPHFFRRRFRRKVTQLR